MTDSHTSRLDAALDGRYRIERKLGEGGMASVYLAEDIKHERKVALKILKPELAAVIGAERFLAEIKTTANLQHPHILALFDSGEADGFLYYVMPYVEGETLRDRLDREGQLGVEEAVRIAREVADALDYAHRNDIIHRDIKPANILLHDGRPVVADFGIALAISAAGGGRMTETGLSLGTPHYMSPEQASADRDLSARSDVYSLGCVLYEMLAGQPPHTGPSAQSVLVRILTEDPRPIGELRRSVPAHVAAAVTKAIEKLPADRFDSARQLREALADDAFTYAGTSRTTVRAPGAAPPVPAPPTARPRLGALLPWGLAAAFAAVAGALALRPAAELPAVRATLGLGAFELAEGLRDLRISPDGTALALVFSREGGNGLAVRRSDEPDFRVVAGADGVFAVAFSPDGQWVAYGSRGKGLMKVALSGGAPQPIIPDDGGFYSPLDWGADGTVLYATGGDSTRVGAVPSTGGESVRILEGYAWSGQLLPGGNVLVGRPDGAMFVDPGSDTSWVVVPGALNPRFLPETGHLLWVDDSGAMWAAALDPASGSLDARRGIVLEGVTTLGRAIARFDVSRQGTLVYSTGGSRGSGREQRLVTVALDGTVTEESLDPRPIYGVRWSPDGRFVAWYGAEPGRGSEDRQIYTYDMQVKSRPRRLSATGSSFDPVWSPDGTRLIFGSLREGTDGDDLFVKEVTGDEPERLVLSLPGHQWPAEWIDDDRVLVHSGADGELWIVDLSAGSADSATARPFFLSEDRQWQARLAPRGDLVAYSSTATGVSEIYVRSFPEAGTPEKITEGEGFSPKWSADGTSIYYSEPRGDSLWVARIDRGPPFAVVAVGPAVPWGDAFGSWDLHPDGDRFVATLYEDEAGATADGPAAEVRTFVVTNWFTELRARLGGRGR